MNLVYDDVSAASANVQAIKDFNASMGRYGGKVTLETGRQLYLDETWPLKIDDATVPGTPFPTPYVIEGNQCLLEYTGEAAAIEYSRDLATVGNPSVNEPLRSQRLTVKDLMINSQGRGIWVHDAGKDLEFRNVWTRSKKEGIVVERVFGGLFSNCYVYGSGGRTPTYRDPNVASGWVIKDTNVLTLTGCTIRECNGVGLEIDKCFSLDLDVYIEANENYGLTIDSLHSSRLHIYNEANRLSMATGLKVKQGTLRQSQDNVLTGRMGFLRDVDFDSDTPSRLLNSWNGGFLNAIYSSVLFDTSWGASNSWGGRYNSGFEPTVEQYGEGWKVTIPAGCFDNHIGSGPGDWLPLVNHQQFKNFAGDMIMALTLRMNPAAAEYAKQLDASTEISNRRSALVNLASQGVSKYNEGWYGQNSFVEHQLDIGRNMEGSNNLLISFGVPGQYTGPSEPLEYYIGGHILFF